MATAMSRRPWFRQLERGQVRALVAAWIGYVLDGFDFFLLTYVLTEIAHEFEVSLATASTLLLATFGSRWLGGAVVGSVADRFGRKNAMVLGILLYSGGTALCGLSWSFASLFVFRLIVGLGMAGEYSASSTYAVESWPAHLKNKASAFLITGFPVGGVLAAQVYPLVVPALGWRALFFLGIAPVFVALYIRKKAPESPEWQANQGRGPQRQFSVLLLFTRRYLPLTLTLALVVFSAFCSNWPVEGLMPSYLKNIGYDPQGVGNIMTVGSIGTLLGTVTAGFIGDRVGTRPAYVGILLVSLVFLFPMFLVDEDQTFLLPALTFAFMWTNFGASGLLPKYLYDHFGVDLRGSGLGFIYNVGAIGGGVAPVFSTAFANSWGLGPAMMFVTAFFVLLLCALVGSNLPMRVSNTADSGAPSEKADYTVRDSTHS